MTPALMTHRIWFGSLLVGLIWSGFAAAQDHSKPKIVLEWRSEVIRSLTFTSDGKQLVVSPKDDDCWVFDAETGKKSDIDLKGRDSTHLLLAGPRPGTVYCFEQAVSRLVDIATGKDLTNNGSLVELSAGGQLSPRRDRLIMATAAGGVEILTADLKRSEGSFVSSDPALSPPCHAGRPRRR